MSDENRKFERISSRLRCWCEGENITVYARIGNLGEGGLFLRTSTPLEEGSLAILRFGLGEPQEVEAGAVVVWSREDEEFGPPGMGLRFADLDEVRLNRIREIMGQERRGKQAADALSG